jgi:LCP family protein required for cell wall assembly
MIGFGLVLLLVAGAAEWGLRTLTDRYDRSVLKELLLDPAARRGHSSVSGPLNYLLVGSDLRPNSGPDSEQRSDTIIIVHIPRGLDRAYLISVPRDLLVKIPAAGGYGGGSDKINAAFQYGGGGHGGARLLSATLTRLTHIQFDGAALIDFTGFQQVIDLLGGIRMCLDAPVRSIHTHTLFKPGCQQMNGAQALDFARQRYDLPRGDFDRQHHQQQMLRAMLEKVPTDEVMTNPVKLDRIIRAVASSITMDTNGVALEELIFALRGLRSQALVGVQVPSYPEMIEDTSYVLLYDTAVDLFRAMDESHVAEWVRDNPKWVNRL